MSSNYVVRRREPTPRPRKGNPWWLIGRWAFALLCLGIFAIVLVSHLILQSVAPAAALAEAEQGIEVLDRNGNELYTVAGPNGGFRHSIELSQVSPYVTSATVAAEDNDFWTNPGVNFTGLSRAVYENLAFWQFGGFFKGTGGSSITQQLARHLYFSEEERYQRTAYRKVAEIALAFQLNAKYSKEEILRSYLNQVFYGNNAYGIEAASERYFDKPATELTLAEAAMLAGLPQAPTDYDPLLPPSARARWPMDKLEQLSNDNLIDIGRSTQEGLGSFLAQFSNDRLAQLPVEALATLPPERQNKLPQVLQGRIPNEAPEDLLKEWTAPEDGVLNRAAKERQIAVLDAMVQQHYISQQEADAAKAQPLDFHSSRFDIKAPHFVMYVLDQVRAKFTPQQLSHGLIVQTTLDPDLQQIGEEEVRKQLEATGKAISASNAALTAMDPRTGEILAMVGSADFWNQAIDGQVNIATALRQPGSTFKAFTYSTAFMKGMTPGTLLNDAPITFRDDLGRPYQPQNFDKSYKGIVPVRVAFSNSMNIPAVETIEWTGVGPVIDTARAMGITTLHAPYYGLSLTLGAAEVKMVDLTYAYGVFANQGVMVGQPVDNPPQGERHVDPIAIRKVTDAVGRTIWEPTRQSVSVMDPAITYMVANVLSDNQARQPVFGNSLQLPGGRPAAVKTGTTEDARDFWTVGFTPSLVTAAWMGNSDNTPLRGGFSGSTTGPIWTNFMARALEGKPVEQFEVPAGIVKKGTCVQPGPNGGCARMAEDLAIANVQPLAMLTNSGNRPTAVGGASGSVPSPTPVTIQLPVINIQLPQIQLPQPQQPAPPPEPAQVEQPPAPPAQPQQPAPPPQQPAPQQPAPPPPPPAPAPQQPAPPPPPPAPAPPAPAPPAPAPPPPAPTTAPTPPPPQPTVVATAPAPFSTTAPAPQQPKKDPKKP